MALDASSKCAHVRMVLWLLALTCSTSFGALVGPLPSFAPWLGGAVWERLHFKQPARNGREHKDELVRYVQCPGAVDSHHGAPFVDLRVQRGALPPASSMPQSL